MKNFKHLAWLAVVMLMMVVGAGNAMAQGDVLPEAKEAIKMGSSRELARYFNSTVEIGFDGNKSNYSQTQAEFVLKDFFSKNPPAGFEFNHQGSSNDGQRYAIGKYNSRNGSYTILIRVRKYNAVYRIDTIEFMKD